MQKVIKPVCESLEEDMKTEKKGKHKQDEFPHTGFRLMLGRLPKRLRWTLHNIVAHPLSEVLNLMAILEGLAVWGWRLVVVPAPTDPENPKPKRKLWLDRVSTLIHNHTVPEKARGKKHLQLEAGE